MASKLAGTTATGNTAGSASSLWKVYTTELTGKEYWYNKATKEKSWTDPSLPAKSVAKDPASKAEPAKTSASSASKDTVPNAPATVKGPTKTSTAEATSSRAVVATKEPSAKLAPAAAGTVPGGTKDAKVATAKTPTSAAAESKKAAAPAALSATKTAFSGAPHIPVKSSAVPVHESATAPTARSSREIRGKEEVHGTTPDEHMTVEVMSKKNNWRGALDVGLRVLDSAMERAKKGENLEKPTGYNAPVVKAPVTKEAAKPAPRETSKEHSAAPSKELLAGTSYGTTASTSKEITPRTEVERPKAASKLSWKSPFKKHAAGPSPPEHESSRSVDDEDEARNSDAITAAKLMAAYGAAPASTSQPASKGPPRGAADDYYNGSDNVHDNDAGSGRVQSGGTKSPGPQMSYIEKDAAAAGVGAIRGAGVHAAGYSAHNDSEQDGVSGDESALPSPPSEELTDDDSGLPSPPPEDDSGLPTEQDMGNEFGPPTVQDDSAPPTPPNESTPSSVNEGSQAGDNPDYTTYAFEQPPSPTLNQAEDDDSNPHTPPVQADSDDGEDQAVPSPNPVEDEDSNPPTPPVQDDSDDNQDQAAPSSAQSASPSPPANPTSDDDSDSE